MAEKKSKASAAGQINDARFAKFESDPRFRLPSKKATKAKLDKRFSRVLNDKDFTATTQVDRYGRKLKSDKKKKALERLYEVEDEDDDDDDDDDDDEKDSDDDLKKAKAKTYDAARGGGFSASESDSDSDSDSDDSDDSGQDSDEGAGGADTQQFREEEAAVATGEVTRRIAIVNLDWDYVKSRDLMAMFSSFVPKDGRGRIERISIYPSQFGKERMQREELEGPPREIFKKKKDDSSDSESDSEDDSEDDSDDNSEEESEDDEKVKQDLLREEDDQDFDSNELRTYQLDRLRYYYAVMTCTDTETSEAIYRATDGREYQASSNFIDLRFIPDETSFDEDEPRDECTEVPVNYKPVDFVTRALQHSKVKLTWDIHPEESARKDMARKAFSGTPSELIENDLRAYLASDSDGSDEDGDDGEVFEGIQEVDATGNGSDDKDADDAEPAEPAPKLSKKEQARQKMRAALGLSEEPTKSSGGKKAPVGGMQITFTPALSEEAAAKKTKASEEETTIEKYKRKEKERKELRKQKAVAKREGRDPDAIVEKEAPVADAAAGDDEEDLGFDDPFFFTEDPGAAADAPKSKTAIRKEERLKKRAAREAEAKEKEESRAHLEAIMGDELDIEGQDNSSKTGHFDLREIMRTEKLRKKEERRKNKNKRTRHDDDDESDGGDAADAAPQTHLGVDVSDPRLQAIFDQPDFAIDPSNAQFKDTIGLQQVLNEARRKRKGGADDKDGDAAASATSSKKAKTAKTATSERDSELANLVNSVKRKAKRNANN
ncbi:pre-rrna-processing protein esf1 [Ophiostoma piceae UAMH 11346]|uniref:Pre-rrna-processing protein esf1 n=1 Tax=Ophiostoma piceae (strain UAMH 11346) TaxID=1262450 RepID=S3CJY6_OPHP1|nr:pre-rrna-processing protein esf1 [Ophiostoma piceae UAMH 11346]